MAYAGTMGHRRRHGGAGLAGRLVGIALCRGRGGPCRRADRLHAVAGAPGDLARRPSLPITIGGVAFNVPPAAIRFKVQRRPGAQARVDLSFVWPSLTPPDLSIKPLPTDMPGRHRPAVRDHCGERQHAGAGRTAQGDLSALRRRRPDRRQRRAQPAGLPRRLAVPGRGSDPGAGVAGALPAPLHPPGRVDPGDVPARAAHRRRRHDGALSARLARAIGGRSPTASIG